MKTVELPSGRHTSRLGFGCGSIGGGNNYRESRKRLFAAFDAGFRHFDVAPSYGAGIAEDYLGRFLRECGEPVTVATKAGIGRPAANKWMFLAQPIARFMFSVAPSIRQHLGDRIRRSASTGKFGVPEIRQSLEDSLRRLGLEHIDVFLMHEITTADYSDELQKFLEDSKQKGLIGEIGIGSRRPAAQEFAREHGAMARIVQTNWTIFDPPLAFPNAQLLITHGMFRGIDRVIQAMEADAVFRSRLSKEVGIDFSNPDALADAMLGAAIFTNPHGMILLSSSKAARLKRYSDAVKLPEIEEVGARFIGAFSTGKADGA